MVTVTSSFVKLETDSLIVKAKAILESLVVLPLVTPLVVLLISIVGAVVSASSFNMTFKSIPTVLIVLSVAVAVINKGYVLTTAVIGIVSSNDISPFELKVLFLEGE